MERFRTNLLVPALMGACTRPNAVASVNWEGTRLFLFSVRRLSINLPVWRLKHCRTFSIHATDSTNCLILVNSTKDHHKMVFFHWNFIGKCVHRQTIRIKHGLDTHTILDRTQRQEAINIFNLSVCWIYYLFSLLLRNRCYMQWRLSEVCVCVYVSDAAAC